MLLFFCSLKFQKNGKYFQKAEIWKSSNQEQARQKINNFRQSAIMIQLIHLNKMAVEFRAPANIIAGHAYARPLSFNTISIYQIKGSSESVLDISI